MNPSARLRPFEPISQTRLRGFLVKALREKGCLREWQNCSGRGYSCLLEPAWETKPPKRNSAWGYRRRLGAGPFRRREVVQVVGCGLSCRGGRERQSFSLRERLARYDG